MTASTAAQAILKFFEEAPPLVPEDMGLLLDYDGVEYFLPAVRAREVTPVLPASRVPGRIRLAVAFWRGQAYPVYGVLGENIKSFVLASGAGRVFFLALTAVPQTVPRRAVPGEVTEFPEEP